MDYESGECEIRLGEARSNFWLINFPGDRKGHWRNRLWINGVHAAERSAREWGGSRHAAFEVSGKPHQKSPERASLLEAFLVGSQVTEI